MFLNRVYHGITYLAVLIWEIIKATSDTAMRAVKGGDTIDPVVIDIKTDLTRPVSQALLANSITLTPGTLTIDIDSENQILKVAIIAPRSEEEVIPFEPYIKKMLE
ncbi:hypothetical protein ALNOE001_21610 [Candidatus Methanobinarius endosymbioticus]|uniref:Monovalent cation/H+ antiporter subunit E n=1 Tax=Candidatus Methanobinarius endosymbioticus TaxID=2006182 RepID=A0A366M9Y7_9EURY|nr:hypothetical protein ALNOE001_21610 [Candidatus Methanobinarius endosymbioticus]